MSKQAWKILGVAFVGLTAALWPVDATAQPLKVTVTIDNVRGLAVVNGSFSTNDEDSSPPVTKLSFQLEAIGVPSLGSRISKVKMFQAGGETLAYRQMQPGEFMLDPAKNTSVKGISNFSYEVDLRPPPDRRSAAHASWVTAESGLLFFEDILPLRFFARPEVAVIKLELPVGWNSATTLDAVNGTMMSTDVSSETVLIGPRIRNFVEGQTKIATGDIWQFSDDKALKISTEIAGAYRNVFGVYPSEERLILLVRFPQQNVPKGTWEAETRGNTVILVSSDMAFESQAVQRLREQLRHELFHLWFPNAMSLTGRYDWFYEGFALYQSLKTGVLLNQITFADFLDTLSRAHTIGNASSSGRLSLLEASSARWAGQETQIYARGMVIAFLCDLMLLGNSNGKRSVETVLRQLFNVHRFDAAPVDGNTAVLRILESHSELSPIVKEHIRGDARVDWAPLITAAGLENEPGTPVTRLRVSSQLSGRQKTLLDKLGYNSWRKLTRK